MNILRFPNALKNSRSRVVLDTTEYDTRKLTKYGERIFQFTLNQDRISVLKKTIALILFLIIFRSFIFSLNENFKIVKIITDQSDHIFSGISDATLTSCKDIIILDGRGNTISKYDWNGNLINRIGQKGRGPGDFYWPTSVSIFNEKIYILDRFNNRFVEADMELKNLKYFRLHKNRFSKYLNVINDNRFIIDHISFDKPDDNKICVIDKNGNIIRTFFNHTPIDINSIKKDKNTLSRLAFISKVTYALNNKSEKLLITFSTSDNPIVLYLYSLNGELIRKFSYQTDKKYGFVHELYSAKKVSLSVFKGRYFLDVNSVFCYNNHWYVFVSASHYKDGNYELNIRNRLEYFEKKVFYLKFDENCKLIGKFDIDPYFKCFHISKEGYVLGKHPHSESEELVIYKIIN